MYASGNRHWIYCSGRLFILSGAKNSIEKRIQRIYNTLRCLESEVVLCIYQIYISIPVFSRATSKEGDPEHLELWARKKGIHLVGTGDFTHPQWREELKEKLEPEGNGLYRLKKEYQIRDAMTPDSIEPRFVVTGEISSIYKKNDKTRKVHNLLILPGLEAADRLSARLEEIGNIHSDGKTDPGTGLPGSSGNSPGKPFQKESLYRPISGPLILLCSGPSQDLTQWRNAFEDLTPHIHAVETGLSSDPPMNWRVSALDRFQLISNSDAHSPGKLGAGGQPDGYGNFPMKGSGKPFRQERDWKAPLSFSLKKENITMTATENATFAFLRPRQKNIRDAARSADGS